MVILDDRDTDNYPDFEGLPIVMIVRNLDRPFCVLGRKVIFQNETASFQEYMLIFNLEVMIRLSPIVGDGLQRRRCSALPPHAGVDWNFKMPIETAYHHHLTLQAFQNLRGYVSDLFPYVQHLMTHSMRCTTARFRASDRSTSFLSANWGLKTSGDRSKIVYMPGICNP